MFKNSSEGWGLCVVVVVVFCNDQFKPEFEIVVFKNGMLSVLSGYYFCLLSAQKQTKNKFGQWASKQAEDKLVSVPTQIKTEAILSSAAAK